MSILLESNDVRIFSQSLERMESPSSIGHRRIPDVHPLPDVFE